MLFLLSLCLAAAFAWFGAGFIKRSAGPLYLLASAVSLGVVSVTHLGLAPDSVLWKLLSNCSFATALFAVVMYMAVLPRGGRAVKRLFPIRAELSILACILTLGHNLAYGKTYFGMLLTRPERLERESLWAALCTVVLIGLMLPLMVTSFPKVRKKMKARAWKRLQRLAYGFYGLTYIHVMLLAVSFLKNGKGEYIFNILVYSAVFMPYGILRLRKGLMKKHPAAARWLTMLLAITAAAMVILMCQPVPKEAAEPDLIPEPTEPVTYIDGTYFGAGEGYIGITQVAVTVTDGRISAVIVISSDDDRAYVEDARDLIPQVIDTQRTDLDAVSGATYTSEAILSAIRDALQGAYDHRSKE